MRLEFKKDGSLNDGADLDGPVAFIRNKEITDLFVISQRVEQRYEWMPGRFTRTSSL